jgi:uncharacterized membrane protein
VKGINPIERVALSLALSVAIVGLLSLALNYTPWGIQLTSGLITVSSFIFIMSVIAQFRQAMSPDRLRIFTDWDVKKPEWKVSAGNKTITLILVVAVLVAGGVLAYKVAVPDVASGFSEFYILGENGKADNYPVYFGISNNQVVSIQYGHQTTRKEGGPGTITMVIINREKQNTTYSVAATINDQPMAIYFSGQPLTRIEQIKLAEDEKWQQEIGFMPQHSGDNQKVEFLLYKDGEAQPENTLQIWVNVKEE